MIDRTVRCVHGTPITPRRLFDSLGERNYCVSHADPRQLGQVIDSGQGMILLDNGAFSHWTAGKGQIDWHGFWQWANDAHAEAWIKSLHRGGRDIAIVIPDVINGTEQENRAKIEGCLRYLRATRQNMPRWWMPMWHMNESLDFLRWLVRWPYFYWLGIGSCAEYDVQRNRRGYLARLAEVRKVIDQNLVDIQREGATPPKVHLMRGLSVAHLPEVRTWVYSADSTNVARNHNRYREEYGDDRVRYLADRVETKINPKGPAS